MLSWFIFGIEIFRLGYKFKGRADEDIGPCQQPPTQAADGSAKVSSNAAPSNGSGAKGATGRSESRRRKQKNTPKAFTRGTTYQT